MNSREVLGVGAKVGTFGFWEEVRVFRRDWSFLSFREVSDIFRWF